MIPWASLASLGGNCMEELLTTLELAEYLKVKPNTLDHWASQGRGPAYIKIEGQRRYSRADLEAWLEGKKVRRS